MRYLYVPIYARNVWIPDDTEQYLIELENKAANDKIRKWIKSKLRKFIIDTATLSDVSHVSDDNLPEYPQWVKDKVDKEKIYYASREALESLYNFSHVLDYLNDLDSDIDNNASVSDVLKQVRDYDKEINLQNNILSEDGYKLAKKYDDGFSWVSVYGKKSLERESILMKYSVGGKSYYNKIKNGKIKIFSLRDKQNMPHVTIKYNVLDNKVTQIRGISSTIPQKYREKIIDFIVSNNFDVDTSNVDILNLGFVLINGLPIDIDNYHGNLIDGKADVQIDGRRDSAALHSFPKIDVNCLVISNCNNLEIKNVSANKVILDDCRVTSNLVLRVSGKASFKSCICKKIKAQVQSLYFYNSEAEIVFSTVNLLYVNGSSNVLKISNSVIGVFRLREESNIELGNNVSISYLHNGKTLAKCLQFIPDNLVIQKGVFTVDGGNLPVIGKNIKVDTLNIINYSLLTKEELGKIKENIEYRKLLKEG